MIAHLIFETIPWKKKRHYASLSTDEERLSKEKPCGQTAKVATIELTPKPESDDPRSAPFAR